MVKPHLKSKDQEDTDKTTRRITESIIEQYIKRKNCTILDKHDGFLRYSEGLKDLFYHNKVIGVGDAISAINPRGGERIRYAMQSADLACEYIHDYLTTGNENFEEYRKKWYKRKLFK